MLRLTGSLCLFRPCIVTNIMVRCDFTQHSYDDDDNHDLFYLTSDDGMGL